jgi:DNA helicase-4
VNDTSSPERWQQAATAVDLLGNPSVRAAVGTLMERWSASYPHDDPGACSVLVAAKPDTQRTLDPPVAAALSRLRSLLSPQQLELLPTLVELRLAERANARVRRDEASARRAEAARRREQRELELQKLERQRVAAAAAVEQRRREEEERRTADLRPRRQALLARLGAAFEDQFLNADAVRARDPDASLLTDVEYAALKARFVKQWASRELDECLDDDQASAIAAVEGDIQVVARAGSGKTRTLVTRAVFLQRHCGVAAEELLLLAFNRKAAEEMRERLAARLGDAVPHVMTFHALAYAIVHPAERLLHDDPALNHMGLRREIQRVVHDYVANGGEQAVRSLMISHFRESWDTAHDEQTASVAVKLELRRSVEGEALDGTYVKSHGEKVIANALFEHGIDYKYERVHYWDGLPYHPDFTVPSREGGVVVEYFGKAGDPEYDALSARKRAYWREKPGWTLIELTASDRQSLGDEGLARVLLERLSDNGFSPERKRDDEIWALIRDRSVSRFAETVATFIGRCRSLGWHRSDVGRARDDLRISTSSTEARFIDVASTLLGDYERLLADEAMDDFSGLVWRAVESMRAGEADFSREGGLRRGDLRRLRHVLVDEFQDFSALFYELINAVRSVNPAADVFAVGDDWQAINGFAGSDLRYFDQFGSYFRASRKIELPTNYRSAEVIVEAGNAVMVGKGTPGTGASDRHGRAIVTDLDRFRPAIGETEAHGHDRVTPALLRIIAQQLAVGGTVEVLMRTNRVPRDMAGRIVAREGPDGLVGFTEHLRSFLDRDDRQRVNVSTAHRSKGLERDAVIVLGATADAYPLIHPTWPFFRVFGDTQEKLADADRRLFYVALTRAKRFVALVTEGWNESPFVTQLRARQVIEDVSWARFPPASSATGGLVEVRVLSAFDVKEELKLLGFAFVAEGDQKYWRKAVPAADFSWSQVDGQPWNRGRVRVEVLDEAGRPVAR